MTADRLEWSDAAEWTHTAQVEGEAFRDVVEAAAAVAGDALFTFDPEHGLTVDAVDEATVAMLEGRCSTDEVLRQPDTVLSIVLPVAEIEARIENGTGSEHDAYVIRSSSRSSDEARVRIRHPYDPEITCEGHAPDTYPELPNPGEKRDALDQRVELPAPKVRGALWGLATSEATTIHLVPENGSLLVCACDGARDDVLYSWRLDADCYAGESAIYSADLLSSIVPALESDRRLALEFGQRTPLRIASTADDPDSYRVFWIQSRIPAEEQQTEPPSIETDGGVSLTPAREAAQQPTDDWAIDEKVDAVSYRDDIWLASFDFVDFDREDVVFSYASWAVDADRLDDTDLDPLRAIGVVDDGEVTMRESRRYRLPAFVIDRVEEAGYVTHKTPRPQRCPECETPDRFRRDLEHDETGDRARLVGWTCRECDHAIDFDGLDESHTADADAEEIDYVETGKDLRPEGYCPSCDAERTLVRTIEGDPNICLACGERVPESKSDGGVALQEQQPDTPFGGIWAQDVLDLSGAQAEAVADAFRSKHALFAACRAGKHLTEYEGIGEATASAIWRWFHAGQDGRVEADGTLKLTANDGLELPDWLIGYDGQITVQWPSGGTSVLFCEGSFGAFASVLELSSLDADESEERLSAGQVALSADGTERIYDIDDWRDGGEDPA